jgi:predicted RNA-binding protein
LAVIYIKGRNIGGIFEIVSLDEKTNIKFKIKEYPYKIKLRKVCVPKEPVEFTKEMVGEVSIFKDKAHWGTILMGRATKEITEEDYNYFKEILRC